MKKIYLVLAFFCSACSPNLPDKERDLADFIPKSEAVAVVLEGPQTFDFNAQNFPKNCDWQDLKRVVDGDTVIVGADIRVRLIGIDTPETKHPKKPIQKFGLESSTKMEAFLKDQKKVCLISDTEGDDFDKYGRKLSYVYREDGFDINAELLKVGLARGYFYFPFERKAEFRAYEKDAKAKKVNLWQ